MLDAFELGDGFAADRYADKIELDLVAAKKVVAVEFISVIMKLSMADFLLLHAFD